MQWNDAVTNTNKYPLYGIFAKTGLHCDIDTIEIHNVKRHQFFSGYTVQWKNPTFPTEKYQNIVPKTLLENLKTRHLYFKILQWSNWVQYCGLIQWKTYEKMYFMEHSEVSLKRWGCHFWPRLRVLHEYWKRTLTLK